MKLHSNIFAGTLATGMFVMLIIVGLALAFDVALESAVTQGLPFTLVAMAIASFILLAGRFETVA